MSKKKQKRPESAARAAPENQAGAGAPQKKKSFYFRRVEKKPKLRKTPILPPREAQQISSNWKSLLGVLNSKPAGGGNGAPQKPGNPKVQKPRPAGNKDVDKAERQKIKDGDKNGIKKRPQKEINRTPGGKSENLERPEKADAQQNGRISSAPKQHKAEKRKARDGGGGGGGGGRPETTKKRKVEEEEKQPTELDIWFDDVDPNDIEATLGSEAAEIVRKRNGANAERTEKVLVKEHAFHGLTSTVAMDCEMVGVGPDGEESILARVSIVNVFGKCVYDKYVKPTEKVTDYRTAVSGIRPADIENGEHFGTVQKEVAEILKGRKLVGHAIHNDLQILFLDHPKKKIRDTQKYKPFRRLTKSGRPALKVLCREVLHVKVQEGEHSSVQDAQATMRLYTLVKAQWEAELKTSRGKNKRPLKSPKKPSSENAPESSSSKDQMD